ncbi:MAG: hypothetical protein Q8934_16160 [Bacillota bacterium]|nr:hypothetical protein [Bacillota bacterium]
MINAIIEESGEEKSFKTTSQTLPLAQMEEEIKAAYIKLLCNFAYDDGVVDSKEYEEITSLIARIEITSKWRLELRNYMSAIRNIEENDTLLQFIYNNIPEGSFDIVKKSLIKDILYIFKLENYGIWSENLFILDLQNKLNLENEQINIILSAIQSDEDILKQKKMIQILKKQ